MSASHTIGTAASAGGRTVRIAVAALAAALMVALLPATADAHRLSKTRAMAKAKVASLALADQLNGAQTSDGGTFEVHQFGWGPCTRTSVHRFRCRVENQGDVVYSDGRRPYTCAAIAIVRFKSRTSSRVIWRPGTDPQCVVQGSSSASAAAEAAGARVLRKLR